MRLKLLLVMLLIAAPCFGATYYVDFVGGSDAHAGTATGTAWKLAPGMSGFSATYTHVAGDHFILKGGVTWPFVALPWHILYGGTAGNVDTYTTDHSWYTGATWSQPIINGQQLSAPNATLIYDLGQSCTGGTNCSYIKIDDLFVENAGNAETGTATSTGSNLVLTDSAKAWAANYWYHYHVYDTTDGSTCYITSSTATTATCTVGLIGGTHNYWTATDAYIITDGSGTAINFTGGGSNIEISNNTIQPHSVQSIAYSNAYRAAGTTSSHILIHGNDISIGGRSVLYGKYGTVVDDVEIYNNRLQGQLGAYIGGYHGDGFMVGNGDSQCIAHGSPWTPTVTNILFHDNYLYGRWSAGTAMYYSASCTDHTTIYNNVFAIETVEATYEGYIIRLIYADGDVSIYNNTMSSDGNPGFDKGATGAIQLGEYTSSPGYGALNIEGNIISGFGLDITGITIAQWSSIGIDYNLHYPSAAGGRHHLFTVGSVGCDTIVCAQSHWGWETHGLLGNPKFVTVPNGTVGSGDFHLLLGSPAIGSSVNLYSIFTTDLGGAARPATGPWDMGVYINGSAPTPALVNVSPVAITFLSQLVGFISPSNVINLFNPTTTTLNIASIVASGTGFSIISTTCGSTLAGGVGCTITTAWTAQMKAPPTAPVTGTITITSDAPSSPDVVTLSGSANAVIMTGGKVQ
jgi:hypothetical protein